MHFALTDEQTMLRKLAHDFAANEIIPVAAALDHEACFPVELVEKARRAGLINSGGASAGESDMKEAVKTAVINKRAGGMGLISGRKAFQRPMKEGAGLLNAIQDVYLSDEVTVA